MRARWSALVLLALTASAFGFDAGRAADVAALKKISDAWDAAIVAKDEKAIAGNMAEDFRQIDGYGNLETKKSFVAGIVDPKLVINPYTVEDFEVRLYEGSGRFDMVYGTVPGNGGSATVGVQDGTGARFTQFECDTGGLSGGMVLSFDCPASLPPLCSLALSSPDAPLGTVVTAMATVAGGTNPPSTGITVSLNAGAVGGGTARPGASVRPMARLGESRTIGAPGEFGSADGGGGAAGTTPAKAFRLPQLV